MAARIFDYLSMHGVYDAAHRITQTIPFEKSQRENFENHIASSLAPFRAAVNSAVDQESQRNAKQTAGVVFEGSFFEY
jgi:hypothetical protein